MDEVKIEKRGEIVGTIMPMTGKRTFTSWSDSVSSVASSGAPPARRRSPIWN